MHILLMANMQFMNIIFTMHEEMHKKLGKKDNLFTQVNISFKFSLNFEA